MALQKNRSNKSCYDKMCFNKFPYFTIFFLLITVALLIAVSIYLAKHQPKDLLPYHSIKNIV